MRRPDRRERRICSVYILIFSNRRRKAALRRLGQLPYPIRLLDCRILELRAASGRRVASGSLILSHHHAAIPWRIGYTISLKINKITKQSYFYKKYTYFCYFVIYV